jgi:hypothetical protein
VLVLVTSMLVDGLLVSETGTGVMTGDTVTSLVTTTSDTVAVGDTPLTQ